MQKISEEINEVKKAVKLNAVEMAFVLKEDLQLYKMYERGRFNKTYSIRQDHLRAKLVLFVELIEDRITELREAKMRLLTYKKNGAPVSSATGRKSDTSLVKRLAK